jgi:hypothetical protein
MVRLRRVPVLVSTLALVAGCGSADRVEVSGIVRDSRTQAPLAGARVTGADGAATHTDADGRFTLAVVRGLRTQLRVSAEGHQDSVQAFGADAFTAPESLAFDLQPYELVVEEGSDPDAVVRWQTAPWVSEASRGDHAERRQDAARDVSRALALSITRSCPASTTLVDDTSEPGDAPDVEVEVGDWPAPWLGGGARCADCHRADGGAGMQAEVVLGRVVDGTPGPHAHLAESCLACHASDGAIATDRCARCHGEEGLARRGRSGTDVRAEVRVGGETRDENREWHVEPIGLTTERSYLLAVAAARRAMRHRVDPLMVRWVELLERDGSRGAHDPRLVERLAERAAAH